MKLLALLLAVAQDAPPFKVPDGFTIERVAGAPLVERPIMACFDDQGRLYVTDSAGVNHKGPELLKNPPHRIRLLEDTDGDGKFDKTTLFADRLVFPQGLLWHDGAVFTVSPPSLWKLEDTNGDGVCDKRTELVTGFANTGVADDVHGSCLGPDGRVYFLPGRMAHNLKLPDGTPIRRATGPWVMRILPDGREVEILSGCVGNPVEIDWLPEGDAFVAGTFWAPDSFGGGLRDAVIHCVEGAEYAVRDRVYNDRKRTGDFLPVLIPQDASAPSGMMVYRTAGPFRGNLFCTYFNWHKVQRHILERDGATFRARSEDFAAGTNADVHPTDVLEDADGSILVVDTGGWFRIGCPTSQIAKPQILGGIYRVRRKDAPRVDDPRGLRIDWSSPSYALLVDPQFVVRERAIRELAKRDLPPEAKAPPQARLGHVWILSRKFDGSGLSRVRPYLDDSDPAVRQAAAHVVGIYRDAAALARLVELVKSDLPQIRREAANALGRIGKPEAVPAIFEALRPGADRYLEHAFIYALIRINDREATLAGLRDASPHVRRAALVALDQMDAGKLTPDLVTPLLDPLDPALQQAAIRVITARPAWAKEVLGLCGEWLGAKELDAARQENLRGILIAFARDATVQDLVARSLRRDETPVPIRLLLLEMMPRAPLDVVPATWTAEARWSLEHADERVARQAVTTLRLLAVPDFEDALLRIARDEARPADLRVESLAAALPRVPRVEKPLFEFLLACLDPERPPLLRRMAAEALGRAPLDEAQLVSLARPLAKAGALELPKLVIPFERSAKPDTGKRFLEALAKAPGLPSLTSDGLRQALKRYPDDVKRSAEPLLKKLEVDLDQQKARLAELEPVLAKGDASRGRDVFNGKKAGCTACHTVQGQGGRVGPDLSKIGAIRTGRDLLEAIIFPSASFARGYEPYIVRTKDGEILDGLINRETADAIYLFTADRVEKRVPRSAVAVIQQSKLSIMPQGLDAQLARDELRDLIAFLQSLK